MFESCPGIVVYSFLRFKFTIFCHYAAIFCTGLTVFGIDLGNFAAVVAHNLRPVSVLKMKKRYRVPCREGRSVVVTR